ncbi:MAG TPA: alpha-galactosidase [Candidatus Hungatella pullicola]|nr:alpha-galactosidase [Candidatus Hungatella pullicola]
MRSRDITEYITLQTKNTTYQIGISSLGFLFHLYYGPKTEGKADYLLTGRDRGFSPNPYEKKEDRTYSLDALPMEYPSYGNGDFRSPAFNLRTSMGVFGADLRYRSHRRTEGKYSIPGLPAVYASAQDSYTVEIFLEDETAQVSVVLKYGVLPDLDVITRSVSVTNTGRETIYINKIYSASLDFLTGGFDLLHFYGRHAMERNLERFPILFGNQSFGSRRGTSSHQHNPFFILAESDTTEDFGSCYGMSLLYSGNFRMEAEKDQYGQTRIQIGLSDEMFDYPLMPKEEFHSPEAAMAYSGRGLAHLSHIYHKLIRRHVCRGKYRDCRRPVLINNWEATYMDFDGDRLIEIARQAAELGVEMFVLDDGWFGERNSDNAGLGDWYVNEDKLKGPLSRISQAVHQMGMKFGLWIEPEMVNEDSQLYREHPDWALVVPGRKPVMGRNQLVLDFSREEVADHIFSMICKVLDSAEIEYIKMDMNRSICNVYTATEGFQNYGQIMHRYMLGVYRFLDKLTTRYPDLLIEGCSGGGGRFDAGMLYYTPQIWCSDNTDAIDRIRIQHGTSFGYPISAVGSHVSAVPNHQTGRITPFRTRAVVAMAGSFGYELDLNRISPQEKEEVSRQIEDYKKYWDLIQNGLYYRLHNPETDKEAAAWEFLSEDRKRVLLNIVSLDTHGNSPVTYIRLKGLDPDKIYHLEGENSSYPGAILMQAGIPVPAELSEYKAWQYSFLRE